MNTKYCPECGYTMIIDINKTILWCPVCDTTKEVKKEKEARGTDRLK